MPRVLTNSHHTRVLTDSYHIMSKLMRDKIHHFWITSNDHFTKQIHLFSNKKLFRCCTSMKIYIQNHVSFCRKLIFGGLTASFASLPILSQAFTVGHICITKNIRAFIEGVSIPACYYPTHIFIFIYTTVQPCWTLSYRTKPT